jgi:hypothetical protein
MARATTRLLLILMLNVFLCAHRGESAEIEQKQAKCPAPETSPAAVLERVLPDKAMKAALRPKSYRDRFYSLGDGAIGTDDFMEQLSTDIGRITVYRDNIEGPEYDGPLGYNVFRVRIGTYPKRKDAGTFLRKGQFRVLGIFVPSLRIIVGSLHQNGAAMYIGEFFFLDMQTGESMKITEIEKQNSVYAQVSPDGRYLVTYQSGVLLRVYNLLGPSSRLDVRLIPAGKGAANLKSTAATEEFLMMDADLSGAKYKIEWLSETHGKLAVIEVVQEDMNTRFQWIYYKFTLPKVK